MEYNFKNNTIKELREEHNLSQQQLAILIGTSQANLSRWEQGVVEPSIIECWKIADYFNVSIDVICGRKDY
jgi:transcriptional regulator with XRE-family HTH domain